MDEDFDAEWDVEYTEDGFWWASTGHATPEQAYQAFTRNHSNPSGTTIVHYAGNEAECEQYALFASTCNSEKV